MVTGAWAASFCNVWRVELESTAFSGRLTIGVSVPS